MNPSEIGVKFTIPLVPPNVNNYVRHTRWGGHYLTKEAIAFKEAVALCARRQYVAAKKYEISLMIWLGKKQRGDVDNFPKLVLDGLVAAGVIHSDAAVYRLLVEKGRDIKNPRTEITVRAM